MLKFVIPVACTYGEPFFTERMVNRYVMKSEDDLFIDCLPLCGGRDRSMVNSYQPFPRSMHVVLRFDN